MSYETTLTGEIEITPPLLWRDIQDSVFLEKNAQGKLGRQLCFIVEQTQVETDEGTLHRKEAVALKPTYGNYGNPEFMQKHLQELVDAFPERIFRGRIEGNGEENVDMWRLKVVNGVARIFRPDIIWEKESE
jgi:Family of unknown function (DUF6205)